MRPAPGPGTGPPGFWSGKRWKSLTTIPVSRLIPALAIVPGQPRPDRLLPFGNNRATPAPAGTQPRNRPRGPNSSTDPGSAHDVSVAATSAGSMPGGSPPGHPHPGPGPPGGGGVHGQRGRGAGGAEEGRAVHRQARLQHGDRRPLLRPPPPRHRRLAHPVVPGPGGERKLRDGWEYTFEYPAPVSSTGQALEEQPDLDPEAAYLLEILAQEKGPTDAYAHTFHVLVPVHQPGGLWDRVLGQAMGEDPVNCGEG